MKESLWQLFFLQNKQIMEDAIYPEIYPDNYFRLNFVSCSWSVLARARTDRPAPIDHTQMTMATSKYCSKPSSKTCCYHGCNRVVRVCKKGTTQIYCGFHCKSDYVRINPYITEDFSLILCSYQSKPPLSPSRGTVGGFDFYWYSMCEKFDKSISFTNTWYWLVRL